MTFRELAAAISQEPDWVQDSTAYISGDPTVDGDKRQPFGEITRFMAYGSHAGPVVYAVKQTEA